MSHRAAPTSPLPLGRPGTRGPLGGNKGRRAVASMELRAPAFSWTDHDPETVRALGEVERRRYRIRGRAQVLTVFLVLGFGAFAMLLATCGVATGAKPGPQRAAEVDFITPVPAMDFLETQTPEESR